MDSYISHAFSYPSFLPWKVIFWVFEFQKKNKCRRITIFEFHFWFLPQWRIQPRVHDYLTAVYWISAPLQLVKFNHWTNFSWKLSARSDPYSVNESWTRGLRTNVVVKWIISQPKNETKSVAFGCNVSENRFSEKSNRFYQIRVRNYFDSWGTLVRAAMISNQTWSKNGLVLQFDFDVAISGKVTLWFGRGYVLIFGDSVQSSRPWNQLDRMAQPGTLSTNQI